MWTSHRQQAANRPTDCASRQRRGGAGRAGAKVQWVSADAIAEHRHLHTHTQIQTHTDPGMLPFAAFSIE